MYIPNDGRGLRLCFRGFTGGSNLKTHESFEKGSAFSNALFPPKLIGVQPVKLVRNQMVRIYEKIKEYIGLPSVQETAVAQWLKCCGTNRFDPSWCHWNFSLTSNPMSMSLGSTQPLTEMSTRNISWG